MITFLPIYFLNFSFLLPNPGLVSEFNLESAVNFLLDSIYETNINDKNLFGLVQLITTMELYKQTDLIENEFHYIKPERLLNRSKIQLKYFNIFSEILFKNDFEIDINDEI